MVNIAQTINEIAEEVNRVLNDSVTGEYFDAIILLYSFIENMLKWLVFSRTLWQKSGKETLSTKEVDRIRSFCRGLGFYNALNIALSIDLVGFDLYKEIDTIRRERNDTIHQLWIYARRHDPQVLREKLETLACVANQLVEISNALVKEIGVTEIYEAYLKGP